jgi:hypothetical protein
MELPPMGPNFCNCSEHDDDDVAEKRRKLNTETEENICEKLDELRENERKENLLSTAKKEEVILDSLVLESCVTNIPYFDKILFERINRRFAAIVRSTFKREFITLTIFSEHVSPDESDLIQKVNINIKYFAYRS